MKKSTGGTAPHQILNPVLYVRVEKPEPWKNAAPSAVPPTEPIEFTRHLPQHVCVLCRHKGGELKDGRRDNKPVAIFDCDYCHYEEILPHGYPSAN